MRSLDRPAPALVLRGRGPLATVFAGTDAGGGAYALKVYPGVLDPATRAAWAAETAALAAAAATAPLLAVRPATAPDGAFAVRSELCPLSLAEVIASGGALGVADALALGEALARALAAAAAAGIVHGGVSATNVLFRAAGDPVLADAGVVLRTAFGAPLPGGPAADVYGLGAVLCLALTGRPGEPDLRAVGELAPPEFAALIGALCDPAPAGRPRAAEVADRLATMSAASRPVPPPSAPADDATPLPAVPVVSAAFDDFGALAAEPVVAEPVRTPAPAPGPAPALAPRPAPGPAPAPAPGPAPATVAAPVRTPPPARPPLPSLPPLPARLASGPARRRPKVLVPVAVGIAVAVLAGAGAATGAFAGGPGRAPAAVPAGPVEVVVSPPVDGGDSVDLAWQAPGGLRFAVVVATDSRPTTVVPVAEARSYRVAVAPGRGYCLAVQATDGARTVESEPRSIRGARCAGASARTDETSDEAASTGAAAERGGVR